MENSAHTHIHPSDELFYPSELKSLYTPTCRHFRMAINETIRSYFDTRAHHFGWNEDLKKIKESRNLLIPKSDLLQNLNNSFDILATAINYKGNTILLFPSQSFKQKGEYRLLLDLLLDIDFPQKDLPFTKLPQKLNHKELKKIFADFDAAKPRIIKNSKKDVKIISSYLTYLGESEGRLVIVPTLGQKQITMWDDAKARFILSDKNYTEEKEEKEPFIKITEKIADKFLLSDDCFSKGDKDYPIDTIFIITKADLTMLSSVDILSVRPEKAGTQLQKILEENQLVRNSHFHEYKRANASSAYFSSKERNASSAYFWDVDPFEYEKRVDKLMSKLNYLPDIFIVSIAPSVRYTPIKETASEIQKLLNL